MKKIAIILSVIMMSITILICPVSANEKDVYRITVDDYVIEFNEGEKVTIPMEYINKQRTTIVGDAGTVTIWGSGGTFYWDIQMNCLVTSFQGVVSIMDITSGLSNGANMIMSFSGSVNIYALSGHTYAGTLDGTAYFMGMAIAKTAFARTTWRA
ncbi:hypothetical protein [Anaerorhabdus sp.]|uniref:hypothetical protein n=1 Tax=Anaerorhabdus sp. TaxID=1872524 RepID=UPI002FCC2461